MIEEPWVTFAESSELIIALCRANDFEMAEQIFNEITNFKDSEGILPTGYQYAEKFFGQKKNLVGQMLLMLLQQIVYTMLQARIRLFCLN